MAKKRSRARSGARTTPAPSPPPPSARVLEPARLAWKLEREQAVAIGAGAAAAVAAYAGLPHFTYYKDHPLVAVALTLVMLGAAFAIDRKVVINQPRSSLRFSGFGLLAPLVWYFLPYGAGLPIAALSGTTVYRLGIGSTFPPAMFGALVTGVWHGPVAGMLVAVAFVMPGFGALLITRLAPRAR